MKKTSTLAFILSILMLSGCFPSGETIGTETAQYDEETFETGLNVSFNITYPESFTDTAQLFSGSLKEWKIHELSEYFISDFDNLSESDIADYTQRENARGAFFSYSFTDGQKISTYPGFISYNRNIYDPRNFEINFAYYCNYGESEKEMSRNYPFTEFSGFSSKEALQYAEKVISDLSITRLTQPQIYSIQSEIDPFFDLNYPELYADYTEEELNSLVGNPAYYILYTVQLDGYKTPVEETYFSSSDQAGIYGFVEFIIDEEGLYYFNVSGYMDYIPTGEYVNICTANEAVARMKSSIGRANELTPTIISGVELLYLGDYDDESKTSTFMPAWRFEKIIEMDENFQDRNFYYYNAETGALIQ